MVTSTDHLASGIQPVIEFYDPSGRLLDPNNLSLTVQSINATAPVTGAYTVVVTEYGRNESGTYQIDLGVVPYASDLSSDAGLLTSGATESSVLQAGDFHLRMISVEALDVIDLTLLDTGGTSFTPRLRLYSPDGILLADNLGNTTTVVNHTSGFSGVYFLVVSDNGDDHAGNYDLTGTGFTGPAITFPPSIPNLDLSKTGTDLILTWRVDLDWQLEHSSDGLSTWQPLFPTGLINGIERTLMITPAGSEFFRLSDE